jgi:hypothetical protein
MHLQRLFMAVALGVDVVVKMPARETPVHQLHTTNFQNAVARMGVEAGGFGVENDLACHTSGLSVLFFGVVDAVFGDFHCEIGLRDDGLAA